jgi:predicted dehydrogenase
MSERISVSDLRIGFIGCGQISRFHADALSALGCKIVAVSARPESKSIEEFKNQYSIPASFDSWQKMIEQQDIDALWVTASWSAIDELLLPVLGYNLPTFFEKPVALSSSKIEAATQLYRSQTAYTQIGYNRRFYSYIPEVRKYLGENPPRSILLEIPETEPRKSDPLAKYLWYQNSSHAIDLLYHLIGPFHIDKVVIQSRADSDTPNSFNGLLVSESGIPINLVANWNVPSNTNITFYCQDSIVKLSPLEMASIYSGLEIVEPTDSLPIRRYLPKLHQSLFCSPVGELFKPGFIGQTKFFIDKINGCEKSKLFVPASLDDALFVTKLIEDLLSRT